MNRREFSLQLAGVAGAAALTSLGLGLPLVARAQGAPVAGKDYTQVRSPVPVAVPGKVEVIEFFWYACPHCFAFEPTLEPWVAKLPADVNFRRVPVAFDARKEVHQQIFYTWEVLGLVGQMHKKTFDRFHVQRKPIDSEDDMLAFAKESGLDVAKVKSAWESFGVQTKMHQAKSLADEYAIDGVPDVAIAGKYLTSPGTAGGGPQCLAVCDYLIGLSRHA